jgi:hypothetical protein
MVVRGQRWSRSTALTSGIVATTLGALLLMIGGSGLRGATRPDRDREQDSARAGFTFARLRYDSTGGWNEAYYQFEGRLWERWETDFPQADRNFALRFGQLTAAQPYPHALQTDLTDPRLFTYPFLYLCDVGWMVVSTEEIERLRQYLLRGGFLWADDFWGDAEWQNFEQVMTQVLPEVRWTTIPDDHSILRTLFPLGSLPQVPAKSFADLGLTHDDPSGHRYPWGSMTPANFRGYFDDDGRLLAVATHNTDIGDGWEREAYGERFFRLYSMDSYATGINIVLHALVN